MSAESSSSLYKIEPLAGADNYQAWKFRMEDILRAQKLWKHAEGTAAKPEKEKMEAWEEKDQLALSQIRLRVKDSHCVHPWVFGFGI